LALAQWVSVKLPDGSSYEGETQNGKAQGQGSLRDNKGNVYTGSFKSNLRDGWGTLKWANGSTYEGQFHNAVKEGQGVFMFANGDVYRGEWRNDKMNGLGTKYDSRGIVIYKGQWADGHPADPDYIKQYSHNLFRDAAQKNLQESD
jgi:hypothetical protein